METLRDSTDLVDLSNAPDYQLENGRNDVIYSYKKVIVEGTDQDIPFYTTNFMHKGWKFQNSLFNFH